MSTANSEHNLTLEIIYADEHLLELGTSFSTYGWCGSATVYSQIESISAFASALEDLSRTLKGEVQFEAGAETGIGYLSMRFYPTDLSGHIACHLKLATTAETVHRPEEIWKASVELHTEPAAIDRFVKALSHVVESGRGQARLTID